MHFFRLAVCFLFAFTLFTAMPGCRKETSSSRSRSRDLSQRRTDRGESLLGAAVAQLQDLPSYVETNLRAPSVILDSTKSGDGGDVLATCTVNPDVPDGLINYILVPESNSRFRTLGVRPGDILKYYVRLDEESLETGIAQQVAMDLTVGQVLSENALLIEGSLTAPVTVPAKLEVWRYEDDRLMEINRQLSRYINRRPPPLAWEPSPDAKMLSQIVVRLNQWIRQSDPKSEWQLSPLLETLPDSLRTDERLKPYTSAEALGERFFQAHEGNLLQEAVWLRNISRWTRGESFTALDRAKAMFDWTIRNIQLDGDESPGMSHRPWQTLLYGQGSAEERAWVFAMLCWQQGLDVVMLEIPPAGEAPSDDTTETTDKSFWLPALLADGHLYLFDTRLGLPIPGPDGEGIATLAQATNDHSVLRQLDLDDAPYPVTAEQLRHVSAAIVASPFNLTRRAASVDSKLSGDSKLSLSVDPESIAEKLRSIDGISSVSLWRFPWETLRNQLLTSTSTRRLDDRRREALDFQPLATRPKLWKARTRHFQGRREAGGESASQGGGLRAPIDDHLEARQLYTDPTVRPPDRTLASVTAADQRRVFEAARRAGTYWLGLLSYDGGNHDVAAHWLSQPELLEEDSPWRSGAEYNLARTLEALGRIDEAVAIYERSDSPQSHGNRLRARRLTTEAKDAAPAEDAASPENAGAETEGVDPPATDQP